MATPLPERHRTLRWLLIDGNRLLVTGLVLAVLFAILLLVDPISTVTGSNATPLYYLFSALLSGNLNLLTIVLAINQLVFSREIKSTDKLRSEIEAIGDLRQSVADAVDDAVAPITPAGFLRVLLDELADHVATLAEQGAGPQRLDADRRRLVAALGSQLDTVESRLSESHGQTVDVLGATLALDFSETNALVCRLRRQGAGESSPDTRVALDRIGQRLEQLLLVRNHFESMYTQENLSKMSRQLLGVGLPAEFLLGVALLWLVGLVSVTPPAVLSGTVVYLLFVIGLAPLAVVVAFVVRAVTIARETAITTQFTAQRQADGLTTEITPGDD